LEKETKTFKVKRTANAVENID